MDLVIRDTFMTILKIIGVFFIKFLILRPFEAARAILSFYR